MGTPRNLEKYPTGPLNKPTHLGHLERMVPNFTSAWRKFRGLSQDELAAEVGTTKSMLGKLERGERSLDVEWLDKLGKALGVEPYQLIAAGPGEAPTPTISVPVSTSRENAVSLRSFDLSYAMGPGTNIDDYVEEGTYDFDAGMLSRLTRASFDRLFVARGEGDSMFPTLVNDDTVVIDTTQTTLNLRDRIWAVSIYGAGAIKRLRPAADGKVEVISDNPAVKDELVNAEDLHIVGRVIWLGRRI